MAYPSITQNSLFVSGTVQGYAIAFDSPTIGFAIAPSAGDLILVIDNIDGATSVPGDITDWTKFGGDSTTNTTLLAYAKNSDGTETGLTIPYTGTARTHNVRVLVIPSALVTDIVSVAQATGGGGSNINSPSVTTVSAENIAIFMMASAADTGTSADIPSGTTLVSYDVGSGHTLGVASLQVATASATGTKTWTASAQAKRAWSIAIAPTAGGSAASITSVTGPASAADTVRATESFTIAGTGFEAAQGTGTVTIGGVACTVTAWGDTSITATGPTAGLMFGGSKTITVTPDSNTADSITGQNYLPETGYDYVTYDGSTVEANSVFWDGDSAVTGLVTGDQAWFLTTATRVGGAETCDFVVEDGTGQVTLENVTEPGDYDNEEVYLRDASDGTDSSAYTVYIDATVPPGSVSWDQDQIIPANETAASFTFAGAEVGVDYEYEITSDAGGTPVSDTGTFATATDQVTAVDVSGLNDGTLTLTVTMTDSVGNESIITDEIDKAAADVTAPTMTSAAVSSNGLSVVFSFNESVDIGAGGNGGFTVSGLTGGACTLTYASGDGTAALTYTTSRTVYDYESNGNCAYTQPGDGIEDGSGNDLASFSGVTLTNGSTVNSVPTDITLSSNTVFTDAGTNAVVGTLTTTDLDVGDTFTYSLVAGDGDDDNASFNIDSDDLRATDPSLLTPGDYFVRIETDDGTDTFSKAFTVRVRAPQTYGSMTGPVSSDSMTGPISIQPF